MAPRQSKAEIEYLPESDRAGELPHPREQHELFGHTEAALQLARAARSMKLHHAWLISGPKGVGKATLAWRFTRALQVHGKAECPDDLSAPPHHTACRLISSLAHPDVMLLRRPWDVEKKRAKSELPVAEVRKLRNFYTKFSSYGGPQITIVDCMDDMNVEAQNGLLKILEEPPKSALLLLIAHAPGKLLPTIISRCQSLHLRGLSDEQTRLALNSLIPTITQEQLTIVSALAEGSPGFAAALADAGATKTYQDILGFLSQMPTLNNAMLFTFAERMGKAPVDAGIGLFSTLLSLAVQRCLRAWFGGMQPLAIEQQAFKKMSLAMSGERWAECWSQARAQFDRADRLNLDKKQFVLNAFYSLESAANAT